MLTIGMDVGGTSIRAGVVDEHGAVLRLERTDTPGRERALDDAVVATIAALTEVHPVGSVGLSVAGFVAQDRSSVRFAPHLAWRQASVAERIAQRVGLPVVLEHDANAAAVGEYRFGAARGADIAVLVAVGTGIGAALLIDGRLFRGAFGVAPELGHLTVVPDGRPCPCGKQGCWERYCSGTALAATARELLAATTASSELSDATGITGRSVAEAARRGDPVASAAMADFAHWLGNGLSLVADVYDPAVIVLGGGVSESADLFVEQADARYLASITGAGFRPRAQLRVAALGDLAGIIGAASLAAEHAAVTVPPG